MTEIERILDLFKRAYEGDAWHGPSVREAIAGVDAGLANHRPLEGAHNIWEVVNHIAVWENVCLRRLQGERAEIEISSSKDWPWVTGSPREERWDQSKTALDRGHNALVKAIARVPESRLDQPILEGMSTVYVTLHGVIQHDLYHAGQISMLKAAMT